MYKLPNFKKLLPDYVVAQSNDDMSHKSEMIELILKSFNVEATVVDVHTGPVITQYELKLASGVSASKVENLTKDLAIGLSAKKIRVVAPIPGKNTIGIELPNDNPDTVYIKDVLTNTDVSDMIIPLILGKDVSGNCKAMDLTKAPHLLIAGQTGSGKSVGINAFITSILTYKTPQEVKLLLIDPKEVELKPYEDCPHVIGDVITKPEDAVTALKGAVTEMDARYTKLADAGVRNIKDFKGDMPYIVVIIDELADLMMTTGKQVEEHIVRIAQKARAVGIHLILTTQRPDVKVITGTIKSNLPSRIGFRVASQIDARTIMDSIGCEKLLGNGDMLFQMSGSPAPERIHGAFISTEETKIIIDACIIQQKKESIEEEEDNTEELKDIRTHPKYAKAIELIESYGSASQSYLQRHLEVNHKVSSLMVKSYEETL